MPVKFSRPSRRTVAAFLAAPIIAVAISSVVLGPAYMLGIIIGAPIAYASALLLGPPLLLLLRAAGALAWSHFAVGGALAALPVLCFYLIPGNTHTELYGPLESAFLISVGAVGGFVFWFIAIRPEQVPAQGWLSIGGNVAVAVLVGALAYLAIVPRTEETSGRLVGPELPFENQERSTVQVQLEDGAVVSAVLPQLVPYRAHCPVHLNTRKALLTHQSLYWVTWYTDDMRAANWHWLPENLKKEPIKKSC